MAGHVRHAAHVDADRWQDQVEAGAVGQPLVGRRAAVVRARLDDDDDAARCRRVRDDVRLLRARTADSDERHAHEGREARIEIRRRLLRGDHGGARGPRRRGENLDDAGRDPHSDSIHRRQAACDLRRCRGKHLVACDGTKRRCDERVPRRLHREVESGAFLVGRVRSRRDAVQRAARTRAPGRGRDDEGGVLARSDQRGVLARQRHTHRTGVLRIRGSGAGGVRAARVLPPQAFYGDAGAGREFFLKYEDVRTSPSPRATLLEFLQSTYDAGATLGHWNRKELER